MAQLSEQERSAQRRIVATVRSCGVLNSDGLAMWREADCGEWKATAAEIGQDLDVLEVPHTVVTAYRFPLANSWNKRMRRGEEVRIEGKDLTHLVRWMPSLKKSIDSLPDDCPGWGFMFFQPKAEGMALMGFALSADWPVWSEKQARAARLLCAECDWDLRRRDDEDRLPYNIPDPDKPNRLRLVCGRCCNQGLDQMKTLAGATGQPS
ncbi:hypothetical protein [Streptomyces geysiriensis]|uniref:hypothetical protein n=1 Tax=Streptomyces geysiriensis TaxID=68207 RepID=UPI001C7D690A|nr:hypothetical protein [Streptomyces geysiriensis]MBX4178402.1 hypothetical protein [Streptomyces geysiriensis]